MKSLVSAHFDITAMNIIAIILPIFFSLGIGMLCRKKTILSRDSIEAVKKVAVNITLPAVTLASFAEADYSLKTMLVPAWIFLCCCAALALGALLVRALHIPGKMTAYLCTGFEGGMLGFTLYPLLYGTRAPFAIVDMGQVFFVFSIYKVLLSGAKGKKALLREAAHSPSLWALFLGVLIGATGFYRRMEPSGLQHVLSSLLNFVSAPTSFLILLSVGYDLQPSEISWKQTLSAIGCRLAIMGLLLAATLTLNRYVLDGIMDPSATILLFALPAPFVLPVFANDPDERGYLSSTLSVMTMITILIFCIMAAA